MDLGLLLGLLSDFPGNVVGVRNIWVSKARFALSILVFSKFYLDQIS